MNKEVKETVASLVNLIGMHLPTHVAGTNHLLGCVVTIFAQRYSMIFVTLLGRKFFQNCVKCISRAFLQPKRGTILSLEKEKKSDGQKLMNSKSYVPL